MITDLEDIYELLSPYHAPIEKKPTRPESNVQEMPLIVSTLILPNGENFISELHKTAESLREETASKGYILYMIEEDSNKLFICQKDIIKFFKAKRISWSIKTGGTIATHVAKTKTAINVDTKIVDLRYPKCQDIPNLYGSNVLAVPIMNFEGRCFGVLEIYRDNGLEYYDEDLQMITYIMKSCGEALTQNENAVFYRQYEQTSSRLNDYFKRSFCDTKKRAARHFLYNATYEIMDCLECQSVTLYLEKTKGLSREASTDDSNEKNVLIHGKETTLAKLTACAGTLAKYFDIYNDKRFDPEIDIKSGRIIRSVLSSPFTRENGLIGVLQMVNKWRTHSFNSMDELFLNLVTPYFVMWSYMENVSALEKQQVNFNATILELILHVLNSGISQSTQNAYESAEEEYNLPTNFMRLSYNLQSTPRFNFIYLVHYIFTSVCGKILHNHKNIHLFAYKVQHCHRENPVHNFTNSFAALHTVFFVITSHPEFFDHLEKLAMLIASFCTYVNARKYSDQFRINAQSAIFDEYSESPVEYQNYWMVKWLVESSELLCHIPQERQDSLFKIIKDIILSNSIRNSSEVTHHLQNLVMSKKLNTKNVYHRRLVRTHVVTAGRYAMYSKEAKNPELRYNLFVEQHCERKGEEDKEANRESYVKFLKFLVVPCFEVLKSVFPGTEEMHKNLENMIN